MMCVVLVMLVGHHGLVSVEQDTLEFHHRPTMGLRREENPQFRAEDDHMNEKVAGVYRPRTEGFLRYRTWTMVSDWDRTQDK